MTCWQSPIPLSTYDEDDDPVKLDFVRDKHLRLDQLEEDEYLEQLIRTSLDMARNATQRPILPGTYRMDGDGFASVIRMPLPPLVEVAAIEYYDASDTLHTLAPSAYRVTAPFGPAAPRGTITLADGQSWPATATRPDAVRITFRAGYVNTTVSPEVIEVPHAITSGRLLVIKDLYENRGISFVGPGNVVSNAAITAERLWWSYRDLTAAG